MISSALSLRPSSLGFSAMKKLPVLNCDELPNMADAGHVRDPGARRRRTAIMRRFIASNDESCARLRRAEDEAGVLLREEALRDDDEERRPSPPASARKTHSVTNWCSQHDVAGRACSRPASRRSRARTAGRGGRARASCSFFRKREHSIGVSVSEMSTETAIVSVTVTANSRNSRPTMPPISSSGMNTATSETEIEMMVKPISPAPLQRRLHRRHAVLDVAVDVLEHHDRVVDDEADRDRQRHQRQVVEAEADQVHHRGGAQQRQRHGDARDQRRRHVAQEDEDHQHDQRDGQHQRELDVAAPRRGSSACGRPGC